MGERWRRRGYTRAEVAAAGGTPPAQGPVCHACGLRVPRLADLMQADRLRVLELIRIQRPMMALAELRAITECSPTWARIWISHCGRARSHRHGMSCPYCGTALASSRAYACGLCGRSWRGHPHFDPDRIGIPIDPRARCYPKDG